MTVSNGIIWTRCDEQAFRFETTIVKLSAGVMPVESETAFQATAKMRILREPPSVSGQCITIIESVAQADSLQRQVGERRRRFTDCKPGVRAALEENNIVANGCKNSGEKRAGKPATYDRDLVIRFQEDQHAEQNAGGSS